MYRRPPDERRCVALNKEGRRCGNWRVSGLDKCDSHIEELAAFRRWLHDADNWEVPMGDVVVRIHGAEFDVDRWAWEHRDVPA
jgi:hypothetical protein